MRLNKENIGLTILSIGGTFTVCMGTLLWGIDGFQISFLLLSLSCLMIPLCKKRRSENTRKKLLAKAAMYLEPYDNIWEYQILVNKNIKVFLFKNVISIQESAKSYSLHSYQKEDIEAVWNAVLTLFSAKTTYDSLIKDLQVSRVYESRSSITFEEKTKEPKVEKIDINNCSEMELTNLPGINIIMAKRIVKKRLEIKGFKSKDEFFEYIKLKRHFVKKLEKQITIQKIKTLKPIKLFKERKVDL